MGQAVAVFLTAAGQVLHPAQQPHAGGVGLAQLGGLERQFLTSGAPGVTDFVDQLCAVPRDQVTPS